MAKEISGHQVVPWHSSTFVKIVRLTAITTARICREIMQHLSQTLWQISTIFKMTEASGKSRGKSDHASFNWYSHRSIQHISTDQHWGNRYSTISKFYRRL